MTATLERTPPKATLATTPASAPESWTAANADDSSTARQLSGITEPRHPEIAAAQVALQRWDSDGGAVVG